MAADKRIKCFVCIKIRDLLCRERDSNPHDLFGSRDFKSLVSTNSTIAAMGFCGCKGTAISRNRQTFYQLFRILSAISVPGAEEDAVEGCHVGRELDACIAAGDDSVVDIVGASALGAVELQSAFLPGEGIVRVVMLFQAVGALSVVGYQAVLVTAGADDDAVVGTEGVGYLAFLLRAEEDVLFIAVVVAGGLQTAYTSVHITLNHTEVSGVAENRRQLTGQGMERGVEDEVATVIAGDGIFHLTGRKECEE